MRSIFRFLTLIITSLVLVFCSIFGHVPHIPSLYYSKAEIALYTGISESCGKGKIIAIGGGFDSEKRFKVLLDECISHTGKKNPKMLFVPTAHFDGMHETEEIVEWFKNAGCQTDTLLVSKSNILQIMWKIQTADIIYETGGNLKFLTETWSKKGVFPLMKAAFLRGAVLIGPSSGAMCWARKGWDDCGEDVWRITDSFPFIGKDSSYDFYNCADILPFCICPHFDNIAWRVFAFKAVELDIPCLCIENGAAVVFSDGKYSVISDSKTPFKTAYLFNPSRNIKMLDVKHNSSFLTLADGEFRFR